jgi:hypothetical protein
MTYLRNGNRHGQWASFCNDNQTILSVTGLPTAISHGEERFRDLLRDGSARGCGVTATFADLDIEQWSALEQFVARFFQEFESYAPLELFPAYRKEGERRRGQ